MAQLRGDAVKARRLAEQIDNLPQHSPTLKRKKTMTDSTTIDSGKTQHQQRRASDKPRSAGARSGFNPLHPSMELPPEQLIRLLGLESKRIRKPKRAHATPVRSKTVPPATNVPPEPERTEPAPKVTPQPAARSTHRQREYESVKAQSPLKRRRGLWMFALATGLIFGMAASAYLFWLQPESGATTRAPAPAANKVNRSPVSSTAKKPAPKLPATATKRKPAAVVNDDPAWLATIDAQTQRLRTEAVQRFDRRLVDQVPLATTVPAFVPQADAVIPAPPASEQDNSDNTPLTATAETTDPAPQTPEVSNFEDISTSELINEQESSPVIDQASQSDEVAEPVPATEPPAPEMEPSAPETLPQENVSELF